MLKWNLYLRENSLKLYTIIFNLSYKLIRNLNFLYRHQLNKFEDYYLSIFNKKDYFLRVNTFI